MITKISNPVTWEELTTVLGYDPDTGIFTWKEKRSNNTKAGDLAGSIDANNYCIICLGGKRYKAHILAWFYTFKVWPSLQIDHINRVRYDNRISNLREVSPHINSINKNVASPTSSGYRGVYARGNKFRAIVRHLGVNTNLGTFDTAEKANEAVLAYKLEKNLIA